MYTFYDYLTYQGKMLSAILPNSIGELLCLIFIVFVILIVENLESDRRRLEKLNKEFRLNQELIKLLPVESEIGDIMHLVYGNVLYTMKYTGHPCHRWEIERRTQAIK